MKFQCEESLMERSIRSLSLRPDLREFGLEVEFQWARKKLIEAICQHVSDLENVHILPLRTLITRIYLKEFIR